MNSVDRSFEHLLRKEINNRLEIAKESVVSGHSSSFEQYRESVGRIGVYKEMLDLMDEIKKKLNED